MAARNSKLALGLDFGTESVRALLVSLDGRQCGTAVLRYRHGQLVEQLPSGVRLPPEFALQHPADWMESAGKAVRAALKAAKATADDVLSIGVDFTSCTMLPALADGTPLCMVPAWADQPQAWPKLWKHHAAQAETERINQLARERREPWLPRYGGAIGLEWFWPKVLEALTYAPKVYAAAEVWLEAGDWFVWQLVGGPASSLPRSTCQAGYKATWNKSSGYPSRDFFAALDRRIADVVAQKMPGVMTAPGARAGELSAVAAKRLGLVAGVPVSAAIIDAHAGVAGAGAGEPNTLVMVLGTSSCHMLNAREEHLFEGVAGVVEDGILPGYFGYETGQAAVGDAFDWLRRLVGEKNFARLDQAAAALEPGAAGVACLDWMNGCRTPLMDGGLKGLFAGLAMHHTSAHLYRALLEASAYGLRWIVELFENAGVPVRRLVATGGLPHHNPLLVQIYADVLARPIVIHPAVQGPALGAAILGVLAAGKQQSGFSSPAAAMRAMARADLPHFERPAQTVEPVRSRRKNYDRLYENYRQLAAECASRSPR